MKYLLIGTLLSIIGVLLSIVVWGIERAYIITAGIGIIFIGLSIIISGSMVTGDRMSANFATESAIDRRDRINTTFRLGLIGVPNIILAILCYLLIN